MNRTSLVAAVRQEEASTCKAGRRGTRKAGTWDRAVCHSLTSALEEAYLVAPGSPWEGEGMDCWLESRQGGENDMGRRQTEVREADDSIQRADSGLRL